MHEAAVFPSLLEFSAEAMPREPAPRLGGSELIFLEAQRLDVRGSLRVDAEDRGYAGRKALAGEAHETPGIQLACRMFFLEWHRAVLVVQRLQERSRRSIGAARERAR